jgi:hypothetical protein
MSEIGMLSRAEVPTRDNAGCFYQGPRHNYYLYKDKVSHVIHLEEFSSYIENHALCGIYAHAAGNYVDPRDIMPSLRLEEFNFKTTCEYLDWYLCGNCLRILKGERWQRMGERRLEYILELLHTRYKKQVQSLLDKEQSVALSLGSVGVPKSRKEVKMATTPVITVKMEIEYNLEKEHLMDILEALQELRDKACELGSIELMRVTTDVPIDFNMTR